MNDFDIFFEVMDGLRRGDSIDESLSYAGIDKEKFLAILKIRPHFNEVFKIFMKKRAMEA